LSPLTYNNAAVPETYMATPASGSVSKTQTTGQAADQVELSPAAREVALTGRVSLGAAAGDLTSQQTEQLYGQISSIQSQIASDTQANGGTLSAADSQSIEQLQNQLGTTIYSDNHGGAAPPSNPAVSQAAVRQALEAGRITLNENAGNLSSDQAQQLGSQLGAVHQQIAADREADGGTLSSTDAQAVNQLQSQLSQQIYQAVHDGGTSS
jgi:hypothetical protein